MVEIIEERIVIFMHYRKGKSYNLELANEIERLLTKEGYRRTGIDFTPENAVKLYFSKED